MSFFDMLGKSVAKGWDAGNHGFLGPVGGALGAVGGGVRGLFGNQLAQHPFGLLGSAYGQQDDPNDPNDLEKQLQKLKMQQLLQQQGGGY